MLLVPQHLQQLCARMDSLVAAQVLAARPVAWGLGRLVLDEHLLPAGRLRVLALDAILPDGTLVSYEAQRTGAAALELDLLPFQDALQDGGLDVYLTLAVGAGRFVAAGVRLVEDMVSDAPAVEIPQSLPALQLAAGDYPARSASACCWATLSRRAAPSSAAIGWGRCCAFRAIAACGTRPCSCWR
ncbi:PF05936 domain protein [Bordetella hinzii 5132]|nr:PF05936 domain protein [Bordetella hinzii 5132]